MPLFRALRFYLDVDGDLIGNHRDRLGAAAEDQPKLASPNGRGRNPPAGSGTLRRCLRISQKLNMQSDWARHAVHRQIPRDIAGRRAGFPNAPAFESDLRKFFNVKQLAAQVLVALGDAGIDTSGLNRHVDR